MNTLFAPLLLLLLSAGATSGRSTEVDSLVVRGQQAYATGDHTLALQYFDSALATHVSAGLHLNIGNCHYKLGDVPRAILHYERALRLEPDAEDVAANLELARARLVDRMTERPDPLFNAIWSRLRSGRDTDQWARTSLWGSLTFFLAIAAALLLRGRSMARLLNALAVLLLVVTLAAVALAGLQHRELLNESAAIIMVPKVDVRSEPRSGATVLFMLHKGTKVEVLQDREGWSEVRLPNGNVGWMPPGTLERI